MPSPIKEHSFSKSTSSGSFTHTTSINFNTKVSEILIVPTTQSTKYKVEIKTGINSEFVIRKTTILSGTSTLKPDKSIINESLLINITESTCDELFTVKIRYEADSPSQSGGGGGMSANDYIVMKRQADNTEFLVEKMNDVFEIISRMKQNVELKTEEESIQSRKFQHNNDIKINLLKKDILSFSKYNKKQFEKLHTQLTDSKKNTLTQMSIRDKLSSETLKDVSSSMSGIGENLAVLKKNDLVFIDELKQLGQDGKNLLNRMNSVEIKTHNTNNNNYKDLKTEFQNKNNLTRVSLQNIKQVIESTTIQNKELFNEVFFLKKEFKMFSEMSKRNESSMTELKQSPEKLISNFSTKLDELGEKLNSSFENMNKFITKFEQVTHFNFETSEEKTSKLITSMKNQVLKDTQVLFKAEMGLFSEKYNVLKLQNMIQDIIETKLTVLFQGMTEKFQQQEESSDKLFITSKQNQRNLSETMNNGFLMILEDNKIAQEFNKKLSKQVKSQKSVKSELRDFIDDENMRYVE